MTVVNTLKKHTLKNHTLKRLSVVGAAFGGLVIASFMQSAAAQAQMDTGDQPDTIQELRPTPNEGDRVSRLRALQQGILRRNTASQSPAAVSPVVPPTVPSTSSVSPTSPARERGAAIAVVTPMDNQLSLSLMNSTGTTVTYEVVGDTARRTLMADEAAMLQGIPLPATITVVRQDEGLLDVSAMESEDGMLQLSLMPEPALDSTQGVIRIQEDGQVFVN